MRPLSDQVAETIAITDRVTRNLRITQSYHRILLAMTPLTGDVDVTWPAYAVWASRTVGHYVRADEIPKFARGLVDDSGVLARMLDDIEAGEADKNELVSMLTLPATFLHEVIEQITKEIPIQLGEGNRIVFEELGPAYVSFLEAFSDAPEGDPAILADYLSRYRPGPPTEGGQSMLIDAFTAYHEAMRARDSQTRAEWMLLANLTVGYHEQIRLQGPIASALDVDLTEAVEAHLASDGCGISDRLVRALLRVVPGPMAALETAWRRAATQVFMTLRMPDVTMHLGRDVPPLPDGRPFPIDTTNVSNPKLIAILERLDHRPSTLEGSAARDWSRLGDRMNFIVDVFRSRQQHPPLFDPPFTPVQVEQIDRGRVPGGDLF